MLTAFAAPGNREQDPNVPPLKRAGDGLALKFPLSLPQSDHLLEEDRLCLGKECRAERAEEPLFAAGLEALDGIVVSRRVLEPMRQPRSVPLASPRSRPSGPSRPANAGYPACRAGVRNPGPRARRPHSRMSRDKIGRANV